MRAVSFVKRPQTIALYGPSGGGKTSLAATAPRPLFADSNQGLLSIANRPGLEHVRSHDVGAVKDLDEIYDNCTGTGRADWSKKFGTVVFDHFDDIQAITLDELGERAKDRDDRRDPDEIQQREWGIMRNRLRRYIRKFRRVPMHKILIMGEMEQKDDGRLGPSLLGGLRTDLPYLVDHTIYIRIGKNNKRYIHLDSTDDFYAKTRAWWLPPELRKQVVPFSDTKFLTNLLETIAAGPEGSTRSAQER